MNRLWYYMGDCGGLQSIKSQEAGFRDSITSFLHLCWSKPRLPGTATSLLRGCECGQFHDIHNLKGNKLL